MEAAMLCMAKRLYQYAGSANCSPTEQGSPAGCLPTGNGTGANQGQNLTGDVELDGSTGHQPCPEQKKKMNSRSLFGVGFIQTH